MVIKAFLNTVPPISVGFWFVLPSNHAPVGKFVIPCGLLGPMHDSPPARWKLFDFRLKIWPHALPSSRILSTIQSPVKYHNCLDLASYSNADDQPTLLASVQLSKACIL